jgi:hypothetical protein
VGIKWGLALSTKRMCLVSYHERKGAGGGGGSGRVPVRVGLGGWKESMNCGVIQLRAEL